MDISEKKWQEIVAKVNAAKASGGVDLSTEEDLTLAIMNLISLEEHFFFTAEKTGKSEYFDLLAEVREMRKVLLGKILDKTEGEVWCVSKHLLAAAMRLMEVGTKFQGEGKKEEAAEYFHRAYKIYSLFWALRFKVINLPELKTGAEETEKWSVEDIVNKLVDCCKE
jgi:hypothetical protein